ncbi:MAG: OmpA family protein [Polyangiales bacterium]
MTESRARRVGFLAVASLPLAAVGCGPSDAQLRAERERDELRHEVVEVRQYNDDLKFRVRLVEARNKVLIDLVQGLTTDPQHFQPQLSGPDAEAALQALDRDIEGLIASVRHSQADVEALRAQRAALQSELGHARHALEEARTAQAGQSARIAHMRALLAPMLPLIQAGRINVSMQYGQLTLQLPVDTLFGRATAQLGAEGKTLLAQVAEGLRTASDRQFRIDGPAVEAGPRGAPERQLSAARALAVLEQLVQSQVPAGSLVAATQATVQTRGVGPAGDQWIGISVLPKFEELPQLPSTQELLSGPAQPTPEASDPADAR